MATALDFMVWRSDLRACRFSPAPGPAEIEIPVGQVLLRVDKFAFASHNIDYAASGNAMPYMSAFPAPPEWGRIPVWGFGEVVFSRCDGVGIGERFFGFYPMSTYLAARPERVNEAGFSDGAPHRGALQAVYNRYLRTSHDPAYEPGRESEHMLMQRLFMTSFLVDDFLADNRFFGARAVVLSSASSKIAYALAFLLSRRERAHWEVIGLTSADNVAFVQRLGCYNRVASYDQVESLPAHLPVVYVDMAGNTHLRSELHHLYRDRMKHSCVVGPTLRDQPQLPGDLPGARPAPFIASDHVRKRTADWGPGGVQERFAKAWRALLTPLGGWMRVVHGRGPADVERVYLEVLEGRANPDEGHVLTLWE